MLRTVLLSLTTVLLVAGTALAADVQVGDKAPSFSGLVGVDDKAHGLADFKDSDVVVVAFTCNICPVAVAYEDRFAAFSKKYAKKGVKFVAINVSRREDLAAMKIRAEEKGFNFPYLRDDTQAVSKSYGARVTPHIFVLGKDRTVQYIGAFDNSMAKPTENFVANAVDAVLAGKTPQRTKSRAVGCGIQWKR